MIAASENEITGQWIAVGETMQADENCARIEMLMDNHLEKLVTGEGGWDALYRDPHDHRLWELSFPQSELQGGGPPKLRCISEQDANRKYAYQSTTGG